MKKLIALVSVSGMFLLAGCSEGTMIYEGKTYPISTVEEIVADKLEVENPELDLKVNISEEVDE